MKILITGGHFSPAYALIQEIRENTDIVVVGRKFAFEGDQTLSYEYEICKKERIPFIPITTGRVQRRITRYTFPSLLKIPKGLAQSIYILRKEKPDIIMSFGGYLAVPIVISAKLLGIPVILHEQTLQAGYANKMLSRFSDIVCLSYKESASFFPKSRTVFTGLPIRKEVVEVNKKIDIPKDRKVIYVTGGSTGAHALNTIIEHALSKLLENYTIIHQTGDTKKYQDFNRMSTVKENLPMVKREHYIVTKHIFPDEIGFVYSESDLVISRSGANTIGELLLLSKKAVLIPLPGGQKGEQMANANYFVKHGTGRVLSQDEITTDSLIDVMKEVLALPDTKIHSEYSLATERLVDTIRSLYEEKKHPEKI